MRGKWWFWALLIIVGCGIYMYVTHDERMRQRAHENYNRGESFIESYGKVDGCERAESELEREDTDELKNKALDYVKAYSPGGENDISWFAGVQGGYIKFYDSSYRECLKK